ADARRRPRAGPQAAAAPARRALARPRPGDRRAPAPDRPPLRPGVGLRRPARRAARPPRARGRRPRLGALARRDRPAQARRRAARRPPPADRQLPRRARRGGDGERVLTPSRRPLRSAAEVRLARARGSNNGEATTKPAATAGPLSGRGAHGGNPEVPPVA